MLEETTQKYEFGPFCFDSRNLILSASGTRIPLTPIAASVLRELVKKRGGLVTKEELNEKVWQGRFVEDGNIPFQISSIRSAFRKYADGEQFIETLPKLGYRMAVPVKTLSPPEDVSSAKTQETLAPTEDGRTDHVPVHRRLSIRRFAAIVTAVSLFVAALILTQFRHWMPASPPRVTASRSLTHSRQFKPESVMWTDGIRLYFTDTYPDAPALASVPVEGGEEAKVPAIPYPFVLQDVSSKRSDALVVQAPIDRGGGPLWIMPILGGSPRRVGNVRAESARWSPNEQFIAYTLEYRLYVSNADGSEARELANMPGSVSWIRWSPDGRRLRFTLTVRGQDQPENTLWEIRADGTNLHPLLPNWTQPPHQCCGVWSPDGKYFVFQSFPNSRSDLWLLRETPGFWNWGGSSPLPLTSGPIGYGTPILSKDGKNLFAVGEQSQEELVRYDTKVKSFVPFLDGIAAAWVIFSKNRQWVAYLSSPRNELWRERADGSQKQQLTFAPWETDGYSWSPDGRFFAVRARAPGKPYKVFLLPSSGGELEPLTSGTAEEGVPTWSPDGRQIAFGDVPPVFQHPFGTEMIHIIDLKTHSISTLPGSGGLWTPRWSPQGQYICALTIKEQRLMLFDFVSNKWSFLDATHVNNPTWSEDGSEIYFDTEGDIRTFNRARVGDHSVSQLVSLVEFGWDTRWSGITPDRSPLILWNRISTQIYELDLDLP